jgi:hypothetical protein
MKTLLALAFAGCMAMSPAAFANPPPGSGYVQTNQSQSWHQTPGNPCSTTVVTTYTWTNHSTNHTITTESRYEVYDEACGPIPY